MPECPKDDRAPIPIGLPCDGETLLVLDDALRPVPRETIGDLYIAGVGLSPGYWNDPEKTGQAFREIAWDDRPDLCVYRTGDLARQGEDGLFYFVGRADTQIKSRGYRIELGEIEAALSAVKGLRAVARRARAGADYDPMSTRLFGTDGVRGRAGTPPLDTRTIRRSDRRPIMTSAVSTSES